MALEEQRHTLIEWQVRLLNLAIRNGHSYDRWQKIVNVMILKEPNNFKINQLRVIHLYEQDFNLILVIKWRKMIQHGARTQILHPAQFGGVPGRDAVLPTLIEEFQYEITRASQRPLVHLDYNATACYDRIVLSFGSLISRSFGQHKSIVFVHATTLQEAKYFLKTQLGVSDSFYKHCTIYPIYGSGQGAFNSPAIWCVISSVLFDTYEKLAHGAVFSSLDGKHSVRVLVVGFVDDTSGSVNDFLLPTPREPAHYISLATNNAQRWNDILALSGGALNESKCSYHFMYYSFTIDGLPILTGGKFGPTVTIQFRHPGVPTPLKQLSALASHKTLGVHKAPSSTDRSLYQALAPKNLKHTQILARSPFNRTDAWAYYHAIYLPSIIYPIPSSCLSIPHCEALQCQFKQAFLPKYGFNRNTPNAIVYGCSDFGGLALRNLAVERGIAQVYSLLACLRSQGIASQLATIIISWGQLLSGISQPILEDVTTRLPRLDPMVWMTLWFGFQVSELFFTPTIVQSK